MSSHNLMKKALAISFIITLVLVINNPAQAMSPVLLTITSNNLNPSGERPAQAGDSVPLYLALDAGSHIGIQAEWWLVAYAPDGTTYSYTTSGWRAGLIAYGSGPLACFNLSIMTQSLTLTGNYTFKLLVDDCIDGRLGSGAICASLTVPISNVCPKTPPSLTIRVNGQSALAASLGETVSVDLWMDPKDFDSQVAEWWIVAAAPNGDKYYYYNSAWHLDPFGPGGSPQAYSFSPLIPVNNSFTSPVLNQPGAWRFHFGLDDTPDGSAEMVIHDSATVTIAGQPPVLNVALTVNTNNPQLQLGGTAHLSTTLDGGDYIGKQAEAWLVAKAPDGAFHFYNGDTRTWTSSPACPWGKITLTQWMTTSGIPSPVLNQWGTWTFYFVVDGACDNAINFDRYVWAKTTIQVGGAPQIQICRNCGPYDFNSPTMPVEVTIYPGSWAETPVDFWCVAISPSGVTRYLKLGGGFSFGLDYFTQGTVANLGTNITIDLKPVLQFELGTWTIYFGADPQNGQIDWSNCAYDSCTVEVVY